MERLTHEADFGLEDWEETLFFVKSDPNGAYNIIDIARYQGDSEFDEILKNISLRLAAFENILGDDYNFNRLRELVQADQEGRYIIMRDAERNGVARLKELSEADREGRCVVSPCKVGDRLYTIRTIQDGSFTLEIHDAGEIRQISVNTNGTFFLVDYGHSLSANNFGKTVFRTREEAEAALKARKRVENDG